jgi:branched-chain amino acid transport system substrate-binding protein
VGVTKSNITISVVAGFSGPFAQVNQEILTGLQIWRDDVNDRGGINGRKITLVQVDHKDTTDGGVAACKEVERNGSYLAIVPAGVPGLLSSVDCLDRAGFPVLYHEAPTFLSSKWTHAYGGLWTPYDVTAKSLASFVKNVDKDGKKKLGVIHINQAYYKRIADRYVAEAKHLGMNVAVVQPVQENQSSFVSEMQRMQQAGVENVVLVVALEAVGIWRDSRAIGYSPRWTAMILTLDFLTKAARDLATGVRGLRPYATVDTPTYAKFKTRAQQLGYTVDTFGGEQFYSYGAGLAMGEGIKRAGLDPTRNSLFAGLDSMTNYNNNIQAPIAWGPGKYTGTKASFPVVCCDANWNWKRLGPPKENF